MELAKPPPNVACCNSNKNFVGRVEVINIRLETSLNYKLTIRREYPSLLAVPDLLAMRCEKRLSYPEGRRQKIEGSRARKLPSHLPGVLGYLAKTSIKPEFI